MFVNSRQGMICANGNGNGIARMLAMLSCQLEGTLSKLFHPKTTTFLLAAVPQFEGSPALQSLIMSLLLIASGTAIHLLKTLLCDQASALLEECKCLFG